MGAVSHDAGLDQVFCYQLSVDQRRTSFFEHVGDQQL